jgi:hypothetical protein
MEQRVEKKIIKKETKEGRKEKGIRNNGFCKELIAYFSLIIHGPPSNDGGNTVTAK